MQEKERGLHTICTYIPGNAKGSKTTTVGMADFILTDCCVFIDSPSQWVRVSCNCYCFYLLDGVCCICKRIKLKKANASGRALCTERKERLYLVGTLYITYKSNHKNGKVHLVRSFLN